MPAARRKPKPKPADPLDWLRRYSRPGCPDAYARASREAIRHHVRTAALIQARARAKVADPEAMARECGMNAIDHTRDASLSLHQLARKSLEYARMRASMGGAYAGYPGDRPAREKFDALQAGTDPNPLATLHHALALEVDATLAEVRDAGQRVAHLYHNGDVRTARNLDKLPAAVAQHVREARRERKRYKMGPPADYHFHP